MNPFIELARAPVVTLGYLAYALLLLGVSIALAGVLWSTLLHLRNAWEYRHVRDKFGPQWSYAPPLAIYGRVAAVCLLVALEAALLGALIWLASP